LIGEEALGGEPGGEGGGVGGDVEAVGGTLG